MSSNDNNIEKRSFEAFVNAIGSEIEQAQVRLISAANAQMLFHYWKMGNYNIVPPEPTRLGRQGHQETGAGDTVQLSRKERIFGQELGLYVPVRSAPIHWTHYEVS